MSSPAERPDPAPAEGIERLLAIDLALGRIAIGAGLWLLPGITSRVLGFGEPDARMLAIGRVAASRDLVLAALQLAALGDRKRLGQVSGAVAACDAGDTLAFALAVGDPKTRAAGLRGVVGAGVATAAGAWLTSRLSD